MEHFAKKFLRTGVLVIGDLMVDHYIRGKVERISPEAPVPVIEVTDDDKLLFGGAANVANNILSLGGRVLVSGVVGNDAPGRFLRESFKAGGIDTDGIFEESNRPTTMKTRVYAHEQQVVRLDKEMKTDISKRSEERILAYVRACLPRIKAIILSDYCKGVITRSLVRRVIRLGGSKIFIAVDPKVGHFDYYRGVSLITPNLNEASFGSGIKITDSGSLDKAGRILLRKLKTRAVLITQGDKGMTLFENGRKSFPIPSTNVKEVYDVTGAGDTVIAVLALYHAAGAPLRKAAYYANHAAGIAVGELGTAVITPKEITESVRKNRKS